MEIWDMKNLNVFSENIFISRLQMRFASIG
jgi:hypothetical protein